MIPLEERLFVKHKNSFERKKEVHALRKTEAPSVTVKLHATMPV
jgi:hypothetical protein